jgi:superfamily II DNA or RNA helicase
MILRPRQQELVDRAMTALVNRGNTIAIAPTGAGKTVMLSAIIAQFAGKNVLVLQHREELVRQNMATCQRMNKNVKAGRYTADHKVWEKGVTFAMVQTLAREKNLATMPAFELVVIDEAHHTAADSYLRIVEQTKALYPDVKILGVTATPERGDSRGLHAVFDNVCDFIQIGELIADGHLVRPRTFVIDLGLGEALSKVRRTASDFDMQEVEAIMNKQAVTDAVIREWATRCKGRSTVIFCSTVAHAQEVAASFEPHATTGLVWGDMDDEDRRQTLELFDQGKLKVLVNVGVLTEGWDCQRVSAVLLLRPCSHKSTMIQMVGRGLRKLDPERYPNVVKSDCLVMDFGYSILTHGDLEAGARIKEKEKRKPEPTKCKGCGTLYPSELEACPVCGQEEEDKPKSKPDSAREAMEKFGMTEVEILDASPFRWEHLWDGVVSICSAMTAWAAVVRVPRKGLEPLYLALGAVEKGKVRTIELATDRLLAIASADDYMRKHGDRDAARKSKSWLSLPATDRQKQLLGMTGLGFGVNRYKAACMLTWKFQEERIYNAVTTVQSTHTQP